MDRKREEYPLVAKLVDFVALIVLFILLRYILKVWRTYQDVLSSGADEQILPADRTSTILAENPEAPIVAQEASEPLETPVDALTQLAVSEIVTEPEQDLPEVLETQPEASAATSSVATEDATSAEDDLIAAEAYCMKCKQKRDMQDVHKIVTKNGRNALEGVCPVCSTRLFRFVSQ